MSGRVFGRRPNPLSQRGSPQVDVQPGFQRKIGAFDEEIVESPLPVAAPPDVPFLSVHEELEAWKKSRKGFTIPWRQLSLTASLSFGVASFVLPASVNRNVDYLLYALMGMSLYVGISKRLKI